MHWLIEMCKGLQENISGFHQDRAKQRDICGDISVSEAYIFRTVRVR